MINRLHEEAAANEEKMAEMIDEVRDVVPNIIATSTVVK